MGMKNHLTFANATKVALVTGLTDHDIVVSYADENILEGTDTSTLMIEISLSKNKKDLIDILSHYISDKPIKPNGQPYITLIADKYFAGKESIRNTVDHLYLCISETQLSNDEEVSIRRIEANFENYAIMTLEEATQLLEDFLLLYKATSTEVPFPV